MRLAKRHLVAQMCAAAGFARVMELMPKRRQLMILNYHRIGDAAQTPYDSGVFSATAEEFDAQITYVKRRFHVTNLEEALGIVRGDTPAGTNVLITFDDGYLDNYTLAFPILRSHKVQAAFFLPTAFIGTGELPWWDTIAFIVKQSRKKVIELRYPEAAKLHLERETLPQAIIGILQLYKRHSMQQRERFISELERSCESSRPHNTSQRCFLNWDEAREMQRAGMAFGSHTHTHEILSKLSPDRQMQEIRQSREILESQLDQRINTLAFPVGNRGTFSHETARLLESAGYGAAFSFYGGLNLPGNIQPFDIRRHGIEGLSYDRFRLQTAVRSALFPGTSRRSES
jgi:peptidoglycan/xylan/chitin deacetylase (PgdA/CDA1 family)